MSNTLQKFEVEIDLSDSNQLSAFHNLLCVIGGHETPVVELKAEEAETAKPAAAKRTPKTTTTKSKPAPEPEEEEEQEEEESTVKLADVRKLLGDKINSGGDPTREKCAAQLKKLGAKNVSTLDSSKYEEFVAFLNKLK